MAMTRLSDATPRMALSRALLSEALRLARSPLTAVHLVCGLAAGLACGEYFSVTRWDPALGADAYAQFLGALMPLMSAIVCGLAVDEERAAGRLANLTAVPSRRRAVAAKLLALAALGGLATLMWTVPGGARETGGPYMRDPRHPRHFTDEFKRQIVDHYNAGKPKREIMDEYDLGKSTVERWIKSINATGSPRAADNRTPEQNRILELERENRRLRMEVDVLKQAALIYARK